MSTSWGEWFLESISSLEKRLNYILEMKRVRELWLQGELYLLSSDEQNLDLNRRGIIPGGEVDLIGQHPRMIAELKICGSGYYPKTLCGFHISNELAAKDEFTFEDMRSHHSTEGSVFKDFCRLYDADDSYEKYMIIVIPKLCRRDTLGQILEQTIFPGLEFHRHHEYFDIRVFQLPNRSKF
ncbi:hypothetical protein [Parendozoicomonas haliclonae]|uniref:Uncharacterized protein n=1 Tax=Parendozoicomonas haliclonae TaxID=1960125 RepID=A0A1X7AIN9_9GAMM|nr:hypothetical protein [Parendozoicomonas haliclonae]SMA45517.1 hypothetical protein EHSB41UT_01939 [Parendozoicomonas haliclonae]